MLATDQALLGRRADVGRVWSKGETQDGGKAGENFHPSLRNGKLAREDIRSDAGVGIPGLNELHPAFEHRGKGDLSAQGLAENHLTLLGDISRLAVGGDIVKHNHGRVVLGRGRCEQELGR